MSMVDNFEETLNELRRFIYKSVPGTVRNLENIEHQTQYFPLEIQKDDVRVNVYVDLNTFDSECVYDERGDRWLSFKPRVTVSWPSYGSVDPEQANRFIDLMIQVNSFAKALLVTFNKPIHKLSATAEEIAARKQAADEEKARRDVQALMRANIKGMRVGQERRVEVPGGAPDLLPVGEVAVWDGDRKYTTHVTATRTIYVMRTA